ncbi:MAG TPA: FAD-linked oxidase C-terminal domain-containing protein [Anaerolineales bacterium]|nr:FAD-linked oxidase C-terminal domain-containing protein [Anaerolineales bacterium]
MSNQASKTLPDFVNSLTGSVQGEIRTDQVTRVLYSTDASIYQVEPLGVFFPKNVDDISTFLQTADEFNVPVLPRGSGSSLAGQAIGPGFIIDCSRYLDKIIEINPEERSAIVEPGLILAELNRSVEKFGLQFGPDPASGERATFGGIIGNNATGAHSIRYGMAADHVLSLEMNLSDGSLADFTELDMSEAKRRSALPTREGDIYRAVLSIRENYAHKIITNWPKTWRRASGYNLNYLLPWSPSRPPQWAAPGQANPSDNLPYPPVRPGSMNLATIMAGSEGSLGVIRRAKIRLVPKAQFTCLVLLSFADLISACDAVAGLLEMQPSAIELIPSNMVKLARTIPAYAKQISVLDGLISPDHGFPNLLAVEFSGEQFSELKDLAHKAAALTKSPSLIAEGEHLQTQIWNVRKVGLGILMSIPGDMKPIPFVEDVSVPVNKLSEFVTEFSAILSAYGTKGDFYAHASAGCLHMRPLVNLKTSAGVEMMRDIADETINLISRLGGAPSGEHGDGIARSEWLERVFGPDIIRAFQELKYAADPLGLLNPGKIVNPSRMDEFIRYGSRYSVENRQTVLDFSSQNGFIGAVEMCNGAGVCRKLDGVMCPSFQATREEMHSTRGRANLLRALLTIGLSSDEKISSADVYQALDLCLACKGCKSECPSAVDMAKMKYEFLEQYYQLGLTHRHPLRDYLFAYIDIISQFAILFKPLANYLLENQHQFGVGEDWLGVSRKRSLPMLCDSGTMRSQLGEYQLHSPQEEPQEEVLFLLDPFTEYYQPEIGIAAWKVLSAAGCKVRVIPVLGSGRTKLSKGFVRSARQHARKVIHAINKLDQDGQHAIIGIEPSEIYTLRDEYPDFFPNQGDVDSIAQRAFMIDEFLIRPGGDEKPRYLRIDNSSNGFPPINQRVILHGHCYKKTQPPAADGFPIGVQATVELLEQFGFPVEIIDAGCCGMAGAFGYEAEHYDLSMEIGELSLFPQVRQAPDQAIISASGFSCVAQIKDGTGRKADHFISLLHDRIFPKHED